MQQRKLGRTGVSLSVVGFGGVVVMNETPEKATELVGRAVERGINYFDVAPSYGNAEERLGPALAPHRHGAFLACKTLERSREKSRAELHESLSKLHTDYVDLYQLHAVTTREEVEQITGPDGALETMRQAREQGLARFLGFSAHSETAALALLERFDFDTILFPFNRVCWHEGKFGPRVLEKARSKGMGILALKALCRRRLGESEARIRPKCWYAPVESRTEALAAMRFSLSLPVTAAVSPGEPELLWWACDAAEELEKTPTTAPAEDPAAFRGLEPLFRGE